jgi:hypothetical protein
VNRLPGINGITDNIAQLFKFAKEITPNQFDFVIETFQYPNENIELSKCSDGKQWFIAKAN